MTVRGCCYPRCISSRTSNRTSKCRSRRICSQEHSAAPDVLLAAYPAYPRPLAPTLPALPHRLHTPHVSPNSVCTFLLLLHARLIGGIHLSRRPVDAIADERSTSFRRALDTSRRLREGNGHHSSYAVRFVLVVPPASSVSTRAYSRRRRVRPARAAANTIRAREGREDERRRIPPSARPARLLADPLATVRAYAKSTRLFACRHAVCCLALPGTTPTTTSLFTTMPSTSTSSQSGALSLLSPIGKILG